MRRHGTSVPRRRRWTNVVALFYALIALVLVHPLVAGEERPLPELTAFLAQVRARLQSDEVRQSHYVFLETRRDAKLDNRGGTAGETLNVYESYPGLPGRSRWKRQLVKNGKSLSPSELAKNDRERTEYVVKYAAQMERQSAADAAAAERRREGERRKNDATVDDAMRIYEISMQGREVVGGHATIVLSFVPRRGVQPRTKDGNVLRRFAGRAWISESEYELVRLEIEATDTLSFGLGMLARIHKGSRLTFERRKVNGEEWLPSSARYTVSGRLLLFKRVRASAVAEFSDYRKFTITTQTATTEPR